MLFYIGDDFDLIQQEIALMQDCQHDNIVRCIGSYLRYKITSQYLFVETVLF